VVLGVSGGGVLRVDGSTPAPGTHGLPVGGSGSSEALRCDVVGAACQDSWDGHGLVLEIEGGPKVVVRAAPACGRRRDEAQWTIAELIRRQRGLAVRVYH